MYAGLQLLRLRRNGACSRRLKDRPSDPQFLCPIGGQPFHARRPCTGHESDGVVTDSKVSEICAQYSIALASFSPSSQVIHSVKAYQGIVTNVSRPSGKPNQRARTGTPAIARNESGHALFLYRIADQQSGVHAAAKADECDNHLLVGMA